MCLDPYLGYIEWYLRVALEIRRIDVLLVLEFVTELWKLCVALEHSCIAYGDHCRIGALSVVLVTANRHPDPSPNANNGRAQRE